jgi:hypothetical protein
MHSDQFATGDFHPKNRFALIKPMPTSAAMIQQTDNK